MPQDDNRLELLLADAEHQKPTLEDGLPENSTQRGPRPKGLTKVRVDNVGDWARTDADPNDLNAQRWGVVAPQGRLGDKLLDAIKPLLRLREEEQGPPPMIFRPPSDLDAVQSAEWKDKEYWSERIAEADRPLYLLMLGDLHHLSVDLQHSLTAGARVGRLHCADTAGEIDLNGYAAYAEKVVRLAREGTPDAEPDMLFYVAQDGTAATMTGESMLIEPSIAEMKEGKPKGHYPYAELRELVAEDADELLAAGASKRPSVMMSMSHGLGPPRRGFKSEDEQQQRQGAMVLGQGQVLDAECVRSAPFLPGGLWFYLACFGAGTPPGSVYHAWLSHLAKESAYSGHVEAVLGSLPKSGQRPFVAAMPQAALANPQGPLAVLGHVDLAWTYGFSNAKKLSESRKGRILSSLQVMLRGGRAGLALEALARFYRETNDALMAGYQLAADARAANRPDPGDPVERGHLWMLRNDLRGYILLGDPAVRLPLRQFTAFPPAPKPSPPEVRSTPPAETPARAEDGTLTVDQKEAAVEALFQGDETPRAIAARLGVSLPILWDWFEAYRAGGRSRLGE